MKRATVLVTALLTVMCASGGVLASAAAVESNVVIGIASVRFDSPGPDLPVTNAKLNAEYAVVKNYSAKPYNLVAFTLRDKQQHVYVFPDYTLAGGASVTVHTGSGTDTAGHLYQDRDYYVWNNTGDTAYRRAFNDKTVNTCQWSTTGTGSTTCPSASPAPERGTTRADFNGDGKADRAVFRPSTGQWWVPGQATVVFGQPGDIPVPSDFTGDGKAGRAVFRPSTGQWYIRGLTTVQYGQAEDIPVASDFNGDGKAERAVFRPSTGQWWVPGQATVVFGQPGDIPVPSDFTGDGKAGRAVFRPSTGQWYIRGLTTVQYGQAEDIPVASDFNGDGKAERAVFRPSTGQWWVPGQATVVFGQPGDIPVPSDFTGDGKADRAVFRPSTGQWYIRGLTTVQYGQAEDIPLPR